MHELQNMLATYTGVGCKGGGFIVMCYVYDFLLRSRTQANSAPSFVCFVMYIFVYIFAILIFGFSNVGK